MVIQAGFILYKMNKIKAKIACRNDFSPWEQSFINLIKTLSPSHSKQRISAPSKNILAAIGNCTKSQKHSQSLSKKSQMGRTVLNLSKINLKNNRQLIQKEQDELLSKAKRYQGPRISFYSKMNPLCYQSPRATPHSLNKSSQRYSMLQKTQRQLIRDDSIKYLQIIEDHQSDLNQSLYPYMQTLSLLQGDSSLFSARRRDEKNPNMRRMKILFNTRKIRNTK